MVIGRLVGFFVDRQKIEVMINKMPVPFVFLPRS